MEQWADGCFAGAINGKLDVGALYIIGRAMSKRGSLIIYLMPVRRVRQYLKAGVLGV